MDKRRVVNSVLAEVMEFRSQFCDFCSIQKPFCYNILIAGFHPFTKNPPWHYITVLYVEEIIINVNITSPVHNSNPSLNAVGTCIFFFLIRGSPNLIAVIVTVLPLPVCPLSKQSVMS